MNTTGNRYRDLAEPISFGQKCLVWLLRLLRTPHVDNKMVADFLFTEIGRDHEAIKWTAV